MNHLLFFLVAAMLLANDQSIYDFKIKALDGKELDFATFKGKKILLVNTASKCGFTPQYEGLEKLCRQYKDKLVIVGFPANNFNQQEPGSNTEIEAFCKKNYGVSFPMAEKISVRGDDIAPLYKWLITLPNPENFNGDIRWNFEKFLFDEHGKLLHRFKPKTEPLSEEVTRAIEN